MRKEKQKISAVDLRIKLRRCRIPIPQELDKKADRELADRRLERERIRRLAVYRDIKIAKSFYDDAIKAAFEANIGNAGSARIRDLLLRSLNKFCNAKYKANERARL